MMLLLSPILMRWSAYLASKQIVPQSVFGVRVFPTFIQYSCVITSVDNHVSKDDNMRLSFKYNIVPQSVLVVCIFSIFIQMQLYAHIGR
jgi:amino acid transporter